MYNEGSLISLMTSDSSGYPNLVKTNFIIQDSLIENMETNTYGTIIRAENSAQNNKLELDFKLLNSTIKNIQSNMEGGFAYIKLRRMSITINNSEIQNI